MIRKIDPFGRITISCKWLKELPDSTVIVSVEEGKIVIRPYDPKRHDLNVLLSRKLDDHALRIKAMTGSYISRLARLNMDCVQFISQIIQ